jgi:disulfide bond formation protein DsbB
MQRENDLGANKQLWSWLFIAWAVALIASASAVFIGEVMGQVPCNLCWYQRIFMFPLVVILGVSVYRSDFSVWRYALPLSCIGLAIAVFHTLQYFGVLPEGIKPCMSEGPSCSGAGMTLWGIVPLPVLSSLSFLVITLSLTFISRRVK